MTASELKEIVGDWPKEAHPAGVEWYRLMQDGKCHGEWWNTKSVISADPDEVAALFRDAGLRFLIGEYRAVEIALPENGNYGVITGSWWSEGTTLLEAIDAAIRAVRG